jgi:hypothetical protein
MGVIYPYVRIPPPVTGRHNSRACGPVLPLSEVGRNHDPAAADIPSVPTAPVGAGGRLTHTARRFVDLNGPVVHSAAFRAERIASVIRSEGGSVWRAVIEFGVSYSHACRIRAGWRPGGRRAEPIAGAVRRFIAAAALLHLDMLTAGVL